MEGGEKKEPRKPDKERLAIWRLLPNEVVASFTKEETNAFLMGEDLPSGIEEKLKDYLVEE